MNDTAQVGYGEITLSCNAPPQSGIVVVSPVNGTAFVTDFSILSKNWVDNDLPLQYTFKYTMQSGGTVVKSFSTDGEFLLIASRYLLALYWFTY